MDIETSIKFYRPRRRREIVCIVLLVLVFTTGGFLIGYFVMKDAKDDIVKCQTDNGSKSKPNPIPDKLKYHRMFQEEIKANNIEEYLRYYTSQPHIAGSKRQHDLALYLAGKWRKYGFDEVEMPEYKVQLSLPQEDKPNMVEVINNGTIEHTILGKIEVKSEPSASKTFDYFPYFAYAPNGTVEGELVYINKGSETDFKFLKSHNISVKDKIVIARGMRASIAMAGALGAVGALLFPDPRPGHGLNKTYPYTPWTSGQAVFEKPVGRNLGDPLTPGIPSIDGMYRRPRNTTDIAAIPAQPISYNDALHLLKLLKGVQAPADWQGGLNTSFNIGLSFNDSNTTVRLQVNNKIVIKSIYNVIGTVYGQEEPDRYVLIGSHRDAWLFGAADPSSGTAALTEISRAVGEMLKEGWRPRRTLKFCSWGAEEFGLVGSIEWVEQNEKILQERGTVYLNTDVAVGGDYVLVSQNCPLLSSAIFSWTKKVKDPNAHGNKTSLYDIMVERNPSKSNPGEPYVVPYQYLSDYLPFYMYSGIPSADFSYFFGPGNPVALYPVYHTQEDNFYWMKTFIDPKFEFHEAVTKVEGGLLIDLADSPLLPFDVMRYAKEVLNGYKSLRGRTENLNISTEFVQKAVLNFMNASKAFDQAKSKLNPLSTSPLVLRRFNDQMVQIEKAFISSSSLQLGSYLMRHIFPWSDLPFPGVKLALKAGKISEVEKQLSLAAQAISSAAEILKPLPYV